MTQDVIIAGVSRARLERVPLDDLRALQGLVMSVYRIRSSSSAESMSSRMATLEVGGSFTLEGRQRYLTAKERYIAGLRNPGASYRSRITTKGLKITRIA